jgi:hypothetical protein
VSRPKGPSLCLFIGSLKNRVHPHFVLPHALQMSRRTRRFFLKLHMIVMSDQRYPLDRRASICCARRSIMARELFVAGLSVSDRMIFKVDLYRPFRLIEFKQLVD